MDDLIDQMLDAWELAEQRTPGVSPDSIARHFQRPELAATLACEISKLRAVEALRSNPEIDSPAAFRGVLQANSRFTHLREFALHQGLARIWIARDTVLGREVVIKSPRHLDGDGTRLRFEREVRAMARLDHPGVIPVYSLGDDEDGRPYYVMPFVRGGNFREEIQRRHAGEAPGADATSLAALVGSLVRICQTLAFAHHQGVIHRDVKSANVLVGEYGQTYVIDWGLAKLAGVADAEDHSRPRAGSDADYTVAANATADGAIMGTPGYLSPEQARGEVVTPASDIYGLGAILYEILTGREPLAGLSKTEKLAFTISGQVPPLRSLTARPIPPALAACCLKAMALQPGERYATALDLAADLENWMRDEPVAAQQESWWEVAARWGRRNVVWIGSGLLVLLVLTVSAIATTLLFMERNAAVSASLQASNRRLYAATIQAASDALRRNEPSAARASLMSVVPQPADDDPRGFEWGHLLLRAGGAPDQLGEHTDIIRSLDWHHGENRLVSGSWDGTVAVWDVARRAVIRRWSLERENAEAPPRKIYSVAFSPAGNRVAVAAAGGYLGVWDSESGNPLWIKPEAHAQTVTGVAFDREGKRLGSTSDDCSACIWNAEDGRLLHRLGPLQERDFAQSIAFRPNGSEVVIGWRKAPLLIWNPQTNARRELPHPGSTRSVAWSANDQWIAACVGNELLPPAIKVYRASDSTEIPFPVPFDSPGDVVYCVRFSPAGDALVAATQEGWVYFWDLVGGQVTRLQYEPGLRAISLGAAGDQIAIAGTGRTIALADLAAAVEAKPMNVASAPPNRAFNTRKVADRRIVALEVSAQGKIYFAVPEGVWSLDSFSSNPNPLGSAGIDEVAAIALSPDGHWLAGVGLSADRKGRVALWQIGRNDPVWAADCAAGSMNSVVFLADSRRFATGTKTGTMEIWSVDSPVAQLRDDRLAGEVMLARSTDDGLTIALNGGQVQRRDLKSGQAILAGKVSDPLACLAAAADGRQVAVGNFSGSLYLLQSGGTDWIELRGHTRYPTAIAFSPDGRRLASCGVDKTVRIWSAPEGDLLATLDEAGDKLTAIRFSADGLRLLAGTTNGSLAEWKTLPIQPAAKNGGGE